MKYEIANLKIKVLGTLDKAFLRRLKEYENEFDEDDYDVIFTNKEISNSIAIPYGTIISDAPPMYWIKLNNNEGYARYDNLPEFKEIFALITADMEWKHITAQFCSANILGLKEDNRVYIALGEIMKLVALKHNGMVIHSSAIAYKNNGIIFSAPSGTGKSTHTALWQKHFPETIILNDDLPIIREIDDKFYVFGTPWSGKTEVNCNSLAPLKAIIFLEQAKTNSIKQISGSEAIWRLINETKKSEIDEMMNLTLNMIDKILSKTPVYVLSCNISEDAVKLAQSILTDN